MYVQSNVAYKIKIQHTVQELYKFEIVSSFALPCMLVENLETVRENTEIFIKASKDIGLELTNSLALSNP